jgi:hypothetical protein
VPPSTPEGKARSLANLKPYVKGHKSPGPGRPKNLARLGQIIVDEVYKSVPVKLADQIVNKQQGELFAMQMMKAAINGKAADRRLLLQFMEQHEIRLARLEEKMAKQVEEGSVEIDWDAEKERAYQDLMARATALVQSTDEDNANG